MSRIDQPLLGNTADIEAYERHPHKNPGLLAALRPVAAAKYSINQQTVQSTRHIYGSLVVDIKLTAGGVADVRIAPYRQKRHRLVTLNTGQLEQDLQAVYIMQAKLLTELNNAS